MRTKIACRTLPDYTRAEELFHMISHIAGICLGIVVLTMSVAKSAVHRSTLGIVCSAVYGAAMIMLYAMSSLYHGLPPSTAKKVFQVLDHCTIYFLIAGTYTPITLIALRPVSPLAGWIIFGLEWAATAVAVTLTSIDLKKYSAFSMVCYLVMGCIILIVPGLAIQALGGQGFTFLMLGGVAYITGAILYGLGSRKRYRHCAFHVFVLLGSLFHFLCIYSIL